MALRTLNILHFLLVLEWIQLSSRFVFLVPAVEMQTAKQDFDYSLRKVDVTNMVTNIRLDALVSDGATAANT